MDDCYGSDDAICFPLLNVCFQSVTAVRSARYYGTPSPVDKACRKRPKTGCRRALGHNTLPAAALTPSIAKAPLSYKHTQSSVDRGTGMILFCPVTSHACSARGQTGLITIGKPEIHTEQIG